MFRDVRVRAVPRVAGFLVLAGGAVLPAAASASVAKPGSRSQRHSAHSSEVRSLKRERQALRTLRRSRRLDVADSAGSGGSGLGATTPTATTKKTGTRTTTTTTTTDPTTVLGAPLTAPVVQDGGSRNLGERTLRKGMKGHDVRELQSYLTLDGFPTAIDGGFGPQTRTSVIKFELANALTPNGIVTYSQSLILRQDVAKAITATGAATGTAALNPDGTVTAPVGAPEVVQQVIAAANSITDMPYVYGGGHGSFTDTGYDCSGAVSFALHGGGLLTAPEDSTQLETYGQAGPGTWITIYADASHAFVVIAGLAFDTAHYGPTTPSGSGPRWLSPADVIANLSDGGNYIVRHPAGL